MRRVGRAILTLAAAGGAALLAAFAVTIVDLYLTGHSRPSIGTPFLDMPSIGVHLSISDLVMLAATFGAGWVAWRATGDRTRAGG